MGNCISQSKSSQYKEKQIADKKQQITDNKQQTQQKYFDYPKKEDVIGIQLSNKQNTFNTENNQKSKSDQQINFQNLKYETKTPQAKQQTIYQPETKINDLKKQKKMNLLDLLTEQDKKNISKCLKISMFGHKTNSDYTKLNQYLSMTTLNNFDPSQVQSKLQNFEEIDISELKNTKMFEKYRQYSYFQERESDKSSSKQQETNISDELEKSYLKIIEQNNADITKCSKEIGMIALKKEFNQMGVNVLYKRAEDLKTKKQTKLNSCNSLDNNDLELEKIQDDYQEIQTHLVQTGVHLDNYYSIKIGNTDEWYFERAVDNKQIFASYLKGQIMKQYPGTKEDDILILGIKKGSIQVDFLFNKPLNQLKIENQTLQVSLKPIVSELKISDDYFDPKWDMSWNDQGKTHYRGNINGEKQQYHLPVGYYGLGLKVTGNNLYPDDGWLKSDTSDETWIALFHKTSPQGLQNIIKTEFKPGVNQYYQNSQCRFGRGKVDKGIYFADKVKDCLNYGSQLKIGQKEYHLIFQCRVNPKTVKSPKEMPNYFICNDPKDVRPYRILLKDINSSNSQQSSASLNQIQKPILLPIADPSNGSLKMPNYNQGYQQNNFQNQIQQAQKSQNIALKNPQSQKKKSSKSYSQDQFNSLNYQRPSLSNQNKLVDQIKQYQNIMQRPNSIDMANKRLSLNSKDKSSQKKFQS